MGFSQHFQTHPSHVQSWVWSAGSSFSLCSSISISDTAWRRLPLLRSYVAIVPQCGSVFDSKCHSTYSSLPASIRCKQPSKQGSLLNCRVLVGLCTSLPCTAMVTFFPLPNGPESFLTLSNTTSLGWNGMWSTSHSAQGKKNKKKLSNAKRLVVFPSQAFRCHVCLHTFRFSPQFSVGNGMGGWIWSLPNFNSPQILKIGKPILGSSSCLPYVFHMCSIFCPCHHHLFICVPYVFPMKTATST